MRRHAPASLCSVWLLSTLVASCGGVETQAPPTPARSSVTESALSSARAAPARGEEDEEFWEAVEGARNEANAGKPARRTRDAKEADVVREPEPLNLDVIKGELPEPSPETMELESETPAEADPETSAEPETPAEPEAEATPAEPEASDASPAEPPEEPQEENAPPDSKEDEGLDELLKDLEKGDEK